MAIRQNANWRLAKGRAGAWGEREPTTRLAAWKHGLEVVTFKQEDEESRGARAGIADDVTTGCVARVVGAFATPTDFSSCIQRILRHGRAGEDEGAGGGNHAERRLRERGQRN
jgi:hypothetical protein